MKIEILQLTDKNSPYLQIISNWQYICWGKDERQSFEFVKYFMENSLCVDRLPQTFIGLIDGEIAGYYQLGMYDLTARPDVYPWLMNIYVDEKFRGRGVCSAFLKKVTEQAKALKIKKLYLYTEHTGLYEKFGWKFLEEVKTFLPQKPYERLYSIEL